MGREPALRKDMNLVIAIDIGGTQFRVALVSSEGAVLERNSGLIGADQSPDRALARIREAAADMLARAGRERVRGLGVAIAGLVTPGTGVLLTSPNLPTWYDTPLKEIWERELGLPAWVGNDANLAALGERRFGAGRGSDDLIYITCSTGVGGGVITGGRLVTGSRGFAGEIGHMTIDIHGPRCRCGNVGCLEVMASGLAIARMAQERLAAGESSSLLELANGAVGEISATLVAEAAGSGDLLASEVMNAAATNLGVGVVNLVHIFNPEIVIIGGGVSKAGDMIFDPVRRLVAERSMPDISVVIVPAALGDDSGLLGAAALVMESTQD
jgi:glucokinase